VWALVAALLRVLRFLFIVLLVYFYLNTVLGLYPWTRPAALILFDLILGPLESLGRGFVGSIPNLMFLFILFLVVRYIIRLTRVFSEGIANEGSNSKVLITIGPSLLTGSCARSSRSRW
jgi:hypothetical protein